MQLYSLLWKNDPFLSYFLACNHTAKNDEISPHFLLGKFRDKGHNFLPWIRVFLVSDFFQKSTRNTLIQGNNFHNFPKRRWKLPFTLNFLETCLFPLNFHPRSMGKFRYFSLCQAPRGTGYMTYGLTGESTPMWAAHTRTVNMFCTTPSPGQAHAVKEIKIT